MSTKLNETPAHELAGLITDLMVKIRKEVISIQELKAFLIMKKEEREKVFGDLKSKHIKRINLKMELTSSGIEIPELTEDFDPKKYFTENKKVRYHFEEDFNNFVLNPSKKVSSLSAMSFDKYRFTKTIYDKEIMEHFQISELKGLMSSEEILRTIAFLTSNQPNGQTGILQNNRKLTIIGYILCKDGVIRTVSVKWRSDVCEWYCYCYDLDGFSWNDINEMFYCN